MTKYTKDILTLAFGLLLIILAFSVGPLILIWSLNTLFPALAIPYAFETWLAVFAASAVLQTKLTFKKD